MGPLRHLRGARRHRRHLGPVPLPGHPLRLRHVHPRLLVPAVGRREGDRRRRRRSCSTSRTPPPRPGIDEHIRFHHRIVARRLVDRRRRAGTSPPSAPTPARPSQLTAGFLFSCTRLLPLRPGLPARLRRHGPLRGHDRAPAGLARGPRLRRQAGRRDRQRRHRGHAHPVDGRDGRARHDAAAVAHLHRLAARQATRSPTLLRTVLPERWSGAGHPLVQRPRHPGASSSSASAGPSW